MSNSNPIKVMFGELLDIVGVPVSFNDTTFIPAVTSLTGSENSGQLPFSDWCKASSLKLPRIIRVDESAPWVFGRLMYLFNSPKAGPDERPEKCCIYESFVAFFRDEGNLAVPFHVSDNYGETFLYFSSENGPPEETRARIADAFYGLLIDDPTSVCNYKNRVYHSGYSEWFDFGVSCGEPYMELRSVKPAKHLAEVLKKMVEPATIRSMSGAVIHEDVGISFWHQPGTEPLRWGGTLMVDMPPGQYEILLKEDQRASILFNESTRQFEGVGKPPREPANSSKTEAS